MAPKHDSKMGYGSTSYQNEETAIEVPQDKPPPPTSTVPSRSLTLSYILACPLGILGLHHFYLGRHRFGVLYLCTGGMLMMGWILDLVRMPCLVRQTNRRLQGQQDTRFRDPQDAYMMLLPPFGLLGFHHYFFGRYRWGVLYTFTMGLFGCGYIADAVRFRSLIRTEEERHTDASKPHDDVTRTLPDAYVLAISPMGMLGAHQYYLGQWGFGILYTVTMGLLGVGWISDIVTMNKQLQRRNKIDHGELDPCRCHLDEAIKLYFPLGFLGLHHFYLRRPHWGLLYFFTAGLFFAGWLADICRLKSLVKEANIKFDQLKTNLAEIQNRKRGGDSPMAEGSVLMHPQILDSSGVLKGPRFPVTSLHAEPKTLSVGFSSAPASTISVVTITGLHSSLSPAGPTSDTVPTMHRAMEIIEEGEEEES